MIRLELRLAQAIERVEPRRTALAVGRSLLAAAGILTILCSPDTALFLGTAETSSGLRCQGIRAVSLWCLAGPSEIGLLTSRILTVVVLVAVLVGFRPKWTCVPHWYVAFSFAAAIPVSNGGDSIAQIATMLLVPLCLGDDRAWQWTRPARPLMSSWRGSVLAAHLAIRVQICLIYAGAVTSKLMDAPWRHGGAMYLAAHHPQYGAPVSLREMLAPALNSYWFVAAASWSVMALQVLTAVLIFGRRKHRLAVLVLGSGLHLGIMFLMGLMSFGMVMIALLIIGSASVTGAQQVDLSSVVTEGGRRA